MPRTPVLLRLDNHGLDAWHWHEKSLHCVARFEPLQHSAFSRWVAEQRPGTRFRLLVDVADEAFEVDSIPRTRGADRKALIARRLANWFPRREFTLARALRRDTENTRAQAPHSGSVLGHFTRRLLRKPAADGSTASPRQAAPLAAGLERMVFSGLTRPDLLEPWLQALSTAGARLDRLISSAQLIGHAVPLAAAPAQGRPTSGLIISFSRAGMRLSAMHQDTLVFSRLVSAHPAGAMASGTDWIAEVDRTRDYLDHQRKHHPAVSGTVTILAPDHGLRKAPAPNIDTGLTEAPLGDAPDRHTLSGTWVFAEPARLLKLDAHDHDGSLSAASDITPQLLFWLISAPAAISWQSPHGASSARGRSAKLAIGTLGLSTALLLGLYAHSTALDPATRPAPDAPKPPDSPAPLPPDPAPRTASLPTSEDLHQHAAQPPEPSLPAPEPAATPDISPPQRIDGILLRPDGHHVIWLDGNPTPLANTGLQPLPGAGPVLVSPRHPRARLHAGDYWTQAHEGPPSSPRSAMPVPADAAPPSLQIHRVRTPSP